MANLTKSIDLSQVVFPVFKIGNEQPTTIDGISIFISRNTSTDEIQYKVLDDKTIDKPTLAARRLHLLNKKVSLKPLRTAIFFVADLIKIADSKTWFIDSKGNIFNYRKSKFCKLTCHRILEIIPISTGGAILVLEGIVPRVKTMYYSEEYKYASILNLDTFTHILYGLHENKFKDTKRKI